MIVCVCVFCDVHKADVCASQKIRGIRESGSGAKGSLYSRFCVLSSSMGGLFVFNTEIVFFFWVDRKRKEILKICKLVFGRIGFEVYFIF